LELNEHDKLIYMRRGKGITLQEIADAIGCTKGLISQYENRRSNMSLDKIAKYKDYISNYGKEIA